MGEGKAPQPDPQASQVRGRQAGRQPDRQASRQAARQPGKQEGKEAKEEGSCQVAGSRQAAGGKQASRQATHRQAPQSGARYGIIAAGRAACPGLALLHVSLARGFRLRRSKAYSLSASLPGRSRLSGHTLTVSLPWLPQDRHVPARVHTPCGHAKPGDFGAR